MKAICSKYLVLMFVVAMVLAGCGQQEPPTHGPQEMSRHHDGDGQRDQPIVGLGECSQRLLDVDAAHGQVEKASADGKADDEFQKMTVGCHADVLPGANSIGGC